MNAFLLQSVSFLLVTAAVLGMAEAVTRASVDSAPERRYQAMFQPGAYQHIVIGSSHSVGGIKPSRLESPEAPLYNFSARGAGTDYLVPWYRAYRRYNPAPATLIYAVDWFMFYDRRMSHRFEQDSEYFPADLIGSMFAWPGVAWDTFLMNRFALLKQREAFQAWLFRQPEANLHGYDPSGYDKGYTPFRGSGFLTGYNTLATPNTPFREDLVSQLDDFVRGLKADGVQVIMVQVPEYLPVQADRSRGNQRLAAIATRHGVPFLNYNGALKGPINQDQAMYIDWGHLNEAGSLAFTTRLKADLATRGLYPPTKTVVGQR